MKGVKKNVKKNVSKCVRGVRGLQKKFVMKIVKKYVTVVRDVLPSRFTVTLFLSLFHHVFPITFPTSTD